MTILAMAVCSVNIIPCNALSDFEIVNDEAVAINRKITTELENIIATSDNDDLIPIYIFRNLISEGLINAGYIVKGFTLKTRTLKSESSTSTSSSHTFTKGQKLRAVLVFGKSDDVSITSSSNMDNIDVNVLNSNGTVVASSASSRNNVEIIEYTIPADGSYSIQAKAVTVCNTTNGVPFSICWMTI